ncbi:glycosyltransferase [Polaromonas sp. AER18D-145]|uniref:glycosyltransferase family 2 protein n=1 Tax=Polaromonas sp. AER18D-145 TaxID=1977060 RepID=UPI0014827DA0|nr:glycosyltransferase [Polaromonas sp. AER18D-145]
MKSTPLVTVVIPTYNHSNFLREALHSVRAQSFLEWEVVVVNNYSTDDTIAVVESFADARIRLENFHNQGVIGAARNRGIALARGAFIAFLDSDDLWLPEKLARCMDNFDDQTDLVCHGLRCFGDVEVDMFCGPASRASFDALLDRGNCITPSATVVRKAALAAAGNFSEDPRIVTSEDYHLWLKLAQAGTRMKFLAELLGRYRIHQGNQSSAVIRHLNSVLQVVQEFFSGMPQHNPYTRRRLQRRIGLAYYSAARALQRGGKFHQAWPMLGKSLACAPFYPRTYAAVLLQARGMW